MPKFYILGSLDGPQGLIRDTTYDRGDGLPQYSYFDARTGGYVANPESGRSIVFGDVELTKIDEIDVPGVIRKLRLRAGLSPG